MIIQLRLVGYATLAMLSAPALRAQQLPHDSLRVEIDGRTTSLAWAELTRLPRADVAISRVDGPPQRFTGIPLRAILERAGLDTGWVARADLARSLLIEARDGYRVAFGLAAVDSAVTGRTLLLAFAEGGQPLGKRRGPWQLIVPGDPHARRSVRQVTAIRVLPAPQP